uniref:Autophagy-related protein 101 n=1 Tax=Caenorhabditis tropicalis TaxID=1561998 RepID=A0A1I7USS0_9PELO
MNIRQNELRLTVEQRQVTDAVECIFHSLLLHRTLGRFQYNGEKTFSIGSIGIKEVNCEQIDMTYPKKMPGRVMSVVLCRPTVSGDMMPVAMGNCAEYEETTRNSAVKPPNDSEVIRLIKSRVRTYFNNDGVIELDGGYHLFSSSSSKRSRRWSTAVSANPEWKWKRLWSF